MPVVYIASTQFTKSILDNLRTDYNVIRGFGRVYRDSARIQRDIDRGRMLSATRPCGNGLTISNKWTRSRPRGVEIPCASPLPNNNEMNAFFRRQEPGTWHNCGTHRLHHRHVHLLAKAFKLLASNTQIKIIRLGGLHYPIDHPDFWDFWPEDGLMFELFQHFESVQRLSSEEGYGYVESLIMKAIKKNKKTRIRAACEKLFRRICRYESRKDRDGNRVVFVPWTDEDRKSPPEWDGRTINCIPASNLADVSDEVKAPLSDWPQYEGS